MAKFKTAESEVQSVDNERFRYQQLSAVNGILGYGALFFVGLIQEPLLKIMSLQVLHHYQINLQFPQKTTAEALESLERESNLLSKNRNVK